MLKLIPIIYFKAICFFLLFYFLYFWHTFIWIFNFIYFISQFLFDFHITNNKNSLCSTFIHQLIKKLYLLFLCSDFSPLFFLSPSIFFLPSTDLIFSFFCFSSFFSFLTTVQSPSSLVRCLSNNTRTCESNTFSMNSNPLNIRYNSCSDICRICKEEECF